MGHRINQCNLEKSCEKDDCTRKHNQLLHTDESDPVNTTVIESSANPALTVNTCSDILQVVAVKSSTGVESIDTLSACDTGSIFSSIDSVGKSMLVIKGKISTLIAAGINVTRDMASEEKSLRAFSNNHDENVIFHIHPSMYLANCSGDHSQLKPYYKDLQVPPNDSVKIQDVQMTWTNYFSLAFLNKLQERSEV